MKAQWCEAANGPRGSQGIRHIRGSFASTPFRAADERDALDKIRKIRATTTLTGARSSAAVPGSVWADDAIRQKIMGRSMAVAWSCGRSGDGLRVGLRGADAALALLDEPAGDHGVGVLVEPLIEEGRDLLAEIGGVAKAREFVRLQGVAGSGEKELPGRLGGLAVHGVSSNVAVTYYWRTLALRIL